MTPHELLGALAGFCTTVATIPQLLKTWHSRHTEDVSLRTFLLLCVGLSLWTLYGLIQGDWPIVVTNGISCALNGALVLLLLARRRDERPRTATRRPPPP